MYKFFSMCSFLFITLYMFRAHSAHHQERQIVSIQPLVTVILCWWPRCLQVGRRPIPVLHICALIYGYCHSEFYYQFLHNWLNKGCATWSDYRSLSNPRIHCMEIWIFRQNIPIVFKNTKRRQTHNCM